MSVEYTDAGGALKKALKWVLPNQEPHVPPRLGLKENLPQFTLLLLVNGFVGAMVGIERSVLPVIAGDEFQLAAHSSLLSFIAVFGFTKALTNYWAGKWADIVGRKTVLVVGWIVAIPFPFILMWAPSWEWIVVANVFLGISQGLSWSATVIMKMDLAGPKNRGFAMGLNEAAGYLAVGLAALITGYIAAEVGLRPWPFVLGLGFVFSGLLLSLFAVQESIHHSRVESDLIDDVPKNLDVKNVFLHTSFSDKDLSTVCLSGMVNNLNDAMAWGLFPLVFLASGMSLPEIGFLAGLYPAVWGLGQLITGPISDSYGRKNLIVFGLWIQSGGLFVTALASEFWMFSLGATLLGGGTALVYPTLLASIGDKSHPLWRAGAVGVYRLWRDLGYAFGAILVGILADSFGPIVATLTIATITLVTGSITALRMQETLNIKNSYLVKNGIKQSS